MCMEAFYHLFITKFTSPEICNLDHFGITNCWKCKDIFQRSFFKLGQKSTGLAHFIITKFHHKNWSFNCTDYTFWWISGHVQHYSTLSVCRVGYFLLPNREEQSPRSLISVKRCAVQRGEGISKKNSEISCNCGEIIKNYIRCVSEPSQAAIQSFPRRQFASCDGGFSTWWGEMCELEAPWQLAMATHHLEGGGRGDLRIDIIQ